MKKTIRNSHSSVFLALAASLLLSGCKKDSLTDTITVYDIDSNVYSAITIGSQTWMKENLKTTHYNNGDPIPELTEADVWASDTTGAYCDFDNARSDGNIYGHLYNYYAVADDRKLCPDGWHIPTYNEWIIMIFYLGGHEIAGSKMKEKGVTHWTKNIDGTNTSGFTALPGGGRYSNGVFYNLGLIALWWSTSPEAIFCVYYESSWAGILDNKSLNDGYSIRCLKDQI